MACPPLSLVSSGTSKSSGSGCAALTRRSCQASSSTAASGISAGTSSGTSAGSSGWASTADAGDRVSASTAGSSCSSTTARAAPSMNPPRNNISPSRRGNSSTRRLRRRPICRYCADLISADAVLFKYAAINDPPWYHGSCTLYTASHKLPANLHQTCIICLAGRHKQTFQGKAKLFPFPPRLL